MFNLSFKFKTILGIALIESIFLFILVFNSRTILQETMEKDIQAYVQSTVSLIGIASLNAVLSKDLATLDSIADFSLHNSSVLYVRIRDLDSTLIEKGNQSLLQAQFNPDSSINSSKTDGSYDALSDIVLDGNKFGSIELGVSINEQNIIIEQATKDLTLIAIIELIFVGLFSLLLGVMLTRRLTLLKESAQRLSKGELGLQIPLIGGDEVTAASKAFNEMSSKIADITEKLNFDKNRLDTIMNTATDSIFMIKIDGNISTLNQAALTLFGYKNEVMVGHNIAKFIPSYKFSIINIPNKNIQFINGITAKGKDIKLEIHSNMTYFDGETYIVGVIRDLTLIDQLQNELKAVLDISESGFLLVTSNDNISYMNESFYTIFDLTPETFEEQHDFPRFKSYLKTILDPERHTDLTLLEKISTPDVLYLKLPKEKIVKVIRKKINENDNKSSQILFFLDITHESIVDRMKTEFLTTAAHELRTPLASVMGFSELLSLRDYSAEKTKVIASKINTQSIRLKGLLDDLLDIATIEQRTVSQITLQQGSIEEVLTELIIEMSAFDNYHFIDFLKPAHWPTVEFNPTKIRQIFNNLLSNAFKYSPETMKIMVSTAIRMEDGVSGFAVIIEDNGIGMTPNELSHVGERFYRVDQTGNIPGTGLGLNLTKEFVKMHNGKLDITSDIGKGTTVIFWLPITISIEHNKE